MDGRPPSRHSLEVHSAAIQTDACICCIHAPAPVQYAAPVYCWFIAALELLSHLVVRLSMINKYVRRSDGPICLLHKRTQMTCRAASIHLFMHARTSSCERRCISRVGVRIQVLTYGTICVRRFAEGGQTTLQVVHMGRCIRDCMNVCMHASVKR
jgi:hypothetical protein